MSSKDCLLCHRETECRNIKTILILIRDAEALDLPPSLMEEVATFRQCMKDLGYQYPNGDQTCNLVDQKEVSRKLVDLGTEILSRISKAAEPLQSAS